MQKNFPPKIDDTWYFRGKFMENLPLLQDGEYLWHKVQNCRRCGAKKTVKKCLWGHPTQEAFESGEWAIMGCCMEPVRSRWACTKCEWKYYHPGNIHAAYKCYVFVEPKRLKKGWNRDKILKKINFYAR